MKHGTHKGIVYIIISLLLSNCFTYKYADTSSWKTVSIYNFSDQSTTWTGSIRTEVNVGVSEVIPFVGEKSLVMDIIENVTTWLQTDLLVNLYYFPENMSYNILRSVNLDDYLCRFDHIIFEYTDKEYYFKTTFIKTNGEKIEFRSKIDVKAEIRYDRRANKAYRTGQFSVDWSFDKLVIHVPGIEQNYLSKDFFYTMDSINMFLDYWSNFENTTPVFNLAQTQLQAGKRYVFLRNFNIENQIDNNTYSAYVPNYQRFDFVIKNYIREPELGYPVFIYQGMDTFITTAGYLRMVPVFSYSGRFNLPNTRKYQQDVYRLNELYFKRNFNGNNIKYFDRKENYGTYRPSYNELSD